MALTLTIGITDRTSVLEKDTLYVEQQAANFVSICSFVLTDVDGDIAIAAEDDISVVDGATTFFAGRVVDVRYSLLGRISRRIHIKCQDLNVQLGETIMDQEEAFPGGAGHAGITADSRIIDHLFDDYLPAVTTDNWTLNQTIQDPLAISFPPCSLRSMLSRICTRTGGYFYVDHDNDLHYFSAEVAGVAWFLSDTPDNVTSFPYLDTDIDRVVLATTRLDGVFVVGAGVSGWRGTHAAGDRQGIARDNRITTTTGRDERGDAVLNKYGVAQVTYTVKTYRAGLRAGMVVRFVCALYGVDTTLTVRRMVVKWDGSDTAYYILTLGDVVNPALLQERNWTEGIPATLGPIPAPLLPTSSRGWSQNIVFSATDHDTVAWAGAGVITLADGTTYTINAGNTGNMAEIHYIYLDIDTAINALQVTHDAATAVGSGKILIAVAEDVAAGKDAIFQVFGGSGQGVMITADNIVALTVTTNEIAANTILAGNIAAGAIETDELNALAVTAAKIAANTITADKINMGIGDGLFNAADGLLLLGPHCEINTTEWWSLRKQLATLSGAFHQEAGRWLGTRGLVVEEATTNLILNPSLEVDTTGWANLGATLTSDTTYSMFGVAALKVVTDNAAATEGPYTVVTAQTAASTEYTLSVWLRGSGTVRLRFRDAGGAGSQYGSVITLTDVWTRYEMTATFGVGAARNVGVFTDIQQAATFYCDGWQLEAQDYATSYADGTLGTGYAWTGAAHGSTSARTVTEINLDALVGLISSNAMLSFRVVVQMPYDADATWPNAVGNALFDTTIAGDRLLLRYKADDNKFAVYIDGADRLESAAQTFVAGDWIDIVVTLDFTADDYNLYLDGLLADNDTTVLAAQGVDRWNLGSDFTGGAQGGFNIVEYAVFDRVLTAIEVAAMYALQRPLVDMGSLDSPGIYILDGKFKIASSTTGNRIEMTADEIAGYDSAGTAQFVIQSSDGKALAGAGAVVLDENGLYTIGDGSGLSMKFRFRYDDAGTERTMARLYGAFGGAPGESYMWVNAMRGAGDPWNGAIVILSASDSVAGTDVRITVDSDNLITMGINAADLIGLGTGAPVAKVHIGQTDAFGAISVLHLDQADVSERMVDFACTIGVGNAIEAAGGKTLTVTHFIKIGGSVGTKYIPVGTIA